MLSSRNSGKYLSGRWAEDREKCAQDRTGFTSAEQAYLEVTGQAFGMGDRQRIDETFTMDSQPLDPEDKPNVNAIDVRKLPGHMRGPGQ